jgi:hypothetical protein
MTKGPDQNSTALSDAERREIARVGFPAFCRMNLRRDWALTIVERHGIAVANTSSVVARISLVRALLPDLFRHTRHNPLIRDGSLMPMAIDLLGPDIKHVRVTTPNGGEAGLRVAATSRPGALNHCRSIGIEPLVG